MWSVVLGAFILSLGVQLGSVHQAELVPNTLESSWATHWIYQGLSELSRDGWLTGMKGADRFYLADHWLPGKPAKRSEIASAIHWSGGARSVQHDPPIGDDLQGGRSERGAASVLIGVPRSSRPVGAKSHVSRRWACSLRPGDSIVGLRSLRRHRQA